MAQNNSVFAFASKTLNDSRERPKLRVDMNQVANLKSLDFTWKKKEIYWEFPQIFNPLIYQTIRFVVDGVAKLVFVSVVAETDDSTALTYEALCFHLTSLHLFY